MLQKFKKFFDNTYQEIFQKTLVGRSIANLRFEPTLKYGESVERVKYDISGVLVRDTVRGAASTIDTISDDSEFITINKEKELVFHISDGEISQAGPLNPGTVIGGKIAHKLSTYVDADILVEARNAFATFDNGDLTTGASTGTPITLTSTTVPQMITRMPAKLGKNNQTANNLVFVLDNYGVSDVEQYLLSKDIDLAAAVFKNGYAGKTSKADIYVSENLTGEAVLSLVTQATANDTVSINGLTWKFVASPDDPGDVALGANVDAARANLAAAINQGAGAGTTYVALSAADTKALTELRLTATNNNTADTLTVVGTGSGRLSVSETLTDATDTWTTNYISAYFGKRGAIDVAVQDMKKVDMRKTDDRRGYNIFSSALYGVKTFNDGKQKFLNVKIKA
jgi:hypothetical protein